MASGVSTRSVSYLRLPTTQPVVFSLQAPGVREGQKKNDEKKKKEKEKQSRAKQSSRTGHALLVAY